MSTAPVIGITLRAHTSAGTPPWLVRNQAYFDAVVAAGATPLAMPATLDEHGLRRLYDLCAGICLPGGPDVQPHLYGEAVREDCSVDVDADLDRAELQLAAWAVSDDKPLLAICRGTQVLNVALGGTLWQDVSVLRDQSLAHRQHGPRDELTHSIEVAPESKLRVIAGSERLQVNSLHHQAVREPGRDLVVTAHAPDGLVEAVEHSGRRFVVGVQCHPEELYLERPWAQRLFDDFVAAARG